MDISATYLLNIGFLFQGILALLLGALLGFQVKNPDRSTGLRTHALTAFAASAMTFMMLYLSRFQNEELTISYTVLAVQIMLAAAVISVGMLIQTRSTQTSLLSAITVWISAAVGVLCGFGYPAPAILIAIITMVFLYIERMFSTLNHMPRVEYCLSIELHRLSVLDKLDDLLHYYDLVIHRKSILRGDHVIIELAYSAYPSVHRLFLRKLFHLPGIGDIIKI